MRKALLTALARLRGCGVTKRSCSLYKNSRVRNRPRLVVHRAALTAESGFEDATRGGERLAHFE